MHWSTFFRIRTEYGEIRCISFILSECAKIRTRITPNTDTFYAVTESTIKGALSGLRQFLTTEIPLIMKNAFCFTSKTLFALKVFKFLSWRFVHVSKRLDYKDKVNFKFYDVTAGLTNSCNTHIAKYIEIQKQSENEICSVNRT